MNETFLISTDGQLINLRYVRSIKARWFADNLTAVVAEVSDSNWGIISRHTTKAEAQAHVAAIAVRIKALDWGPDDS